MFEREELWALMSKADKAAEVTPSPSWKRALLDLADAADRVDAMIARTMVAQPLPSKSGTDAT